MKEILRKMNWIKEKNEISKLKGEIEKKNKKLEFLEKRCREIIQLHKTETEKIIDDLNDKIQTLEEDNSRLEKECNFYKGTLNSIPKFIVKIFSKRKIMIGKGEN